MCQNSVSHWRRGRPSSLALVAGWLLAATLVTVLASAFGGTMQDSFKIPGSDTQRTNDMLADRFPAMSGTTARVVAHDEGGALDLAELEPVRTALEEMPSVSRVAPTALSPDGKTAVISVQYDVQVTEFEGTEALDALEVATEPLEAFGHQVEFGGPVPENVQEVSGHAEMIGVAVALLILLLAFGALLAASLPLIVAITGLLVGSGGISLLAALTDMSTNAPTLASMVGLGVGIDYALFLVSRYRDNLAQGMSVPAAGRARARRPVGDLRRRHRPGRLVGLQFTGCPTSPLSGYATGIVVLVDGGGRHHVAAGAARRPEAACPQPTQPSDGSRQSPCPLAEAARLARMVGRQPACGYRWRTLVFSPWPPRRWP